MDDPILTIDEREAINSGRWFSTLSPSLRHDILRCAYVKRYKDGELICRPRRTARGMDCLRKGAVRVSSTSISGKQITLTYVEPGIWFGDVAIFDGDRRTHDAYAHGDTTILCVAKADFKKILALHVRAVRSTCCACMRAAFASSTVWWKTSTRCPARTLGQTVAAPGAQLWCSIAERWTEMRIGLQLAQEELAQLLGASRQRVNQELKAMEREGHPH
jgi:CRP/FNR family cyclic AMP-dependent transcriptional regulator